MAPGPRVTKQMPGRPVSLPCASAIMAAPPSWRQTVTSMSRVMQRVERRQIALARHAENVIDPLGKKLIDKDLAAGAGGRCHGGLAVLEG